MRNNNSKQLEKKPKKGHVRGNHFHSRAEVTFKLVIFELLNYDNSNVFETLLCKA